MTARRLQVLLAEAGVASRRGSEDLIRAGRVTVNGEVASLGAKASLERDDVRLDGVALAPLQEKVCYVLNKPAGVVTTMRDPQGRPCVASYVLGLRERVFPVGRLDRDSEGLLLLTNDGPLANALMHPRFHVRKKYIATVDAPVDEAFVRQLLCGVPLEDGPLQVLRAKPLEPSGGPRLLLEIAEGRKRVVRRALGALGRRVTRLQRIAVGPVELEELPPGALRRLDQGELQALRRAVEAAEA